MKEKLNKDVERVQSHLQEHLAPLCNLLMMPLSVNQWMGLLFTGMWELNGYSITHPKK